MQVQLANKYDKRRAFEKGLYSRKFDGKRMYYLDGVAYSRDNKVCRPHPILHITEKIVTCEGLQNYVVDGEVIYFEPGFAEDFKKAISMTSRIQRSEECASGQPARSCRRGSIRRHRYKSNIWYCGFWRFAVPPG